MRYVVKSDRIIKICNTFNGALNVVKRYRGGEDIVVYGKFRYAIEFIFFTIFYRLNTKKILWLWQNTFERYDYRGFGKERVIVINEDNLIFSWALSRKEVECIYKKGV